MVESHSPSLPPSATHFSGHMVTNDLWVRGKRGAYKKIKSKEGMRV
jgi:hypothetical protein